MRIMIWFFYMVIVTYLCFCFSSKTLTETGYEKYNEVTYSCAVTAKCRGAGSAAPRCLPAPAAVGFCPSSSREASLFITSHWFLSCFLQGLTVPDSICGFSEHLFSHPHVSYAL